MKIVIEIDELVYEGCLILNRANEATVIQKAVVNGIPLPKHHGRLIDADAFKHNVCTYQQTGCGDCKHSLCCPEDVPTIIEAEGSDSE